jgi:outer membrane receptor for ferrienterochelin and colicins
MFLQAQESAPSAEELMSLSFDELMELNVNKVYGASKYEQPVTQAPSSITIINSSEIKRYGYRTLAEVLRSVRGFYTGNDRNYTYLGVRGFLRPGDNNSRILLLINGHRINDNIYDSAPVGSEFPIDIDLIERVEVIRGPSSALYGNSAFFGVINVVTKKPGKNIGSEVSGEAGSFDRYKTRFSFGDEFKNGASLLVSGSYFDRQGEKSLYYPEFDDPITNSGIARRRDWDQFQSFFTQFNYQSFTMDAGYHVREKGVPTGSFETVFDHPDNQTEDLTAFINARHVHEFSDELELTTRLSYGRYEFNGQYIYEGELPTDPPIIPNFDQARGEWIIGETTFRKRFLHKHQAIAGFEYRYNLQRDQTNFDQSPPFSYLDSRKHGQVWSPYTTVELNLSTNLTLNAGLRHDDYETFGSTTNPRASLIYQARPTSTLKYIYGEAFRAPNAFELYYGDEGFTAKPNPQLSPEEIATHEFIWEEQISRQFTSSASYFQYDIENLITQNIDPADNLLMYRNIDRIRAEGVEFEITGRMPNGLHGKISYAFQQSEDLGTEGELFNAPEHLIKFHLTVPLYRDSIFLGLESLYTSSRITSSLDSLSGFWLNNLTLFSQDLRPGLDLSASIYNLLDQRYFDPAGPEHLQSRIEQEGRSVRVKLTYRF